MYIEAVIRDTGRNGHPLLFHRRQHGAAGDLHCVAVAISSTTVRDYLQSAVGINSEGP